MKDIALVIFPYSKWDITTALLYHTDLFYTKIDLLGVINNTHDEELSPLMPLIQKVQPSALYELVDRKTFRSSAIFWDKADKKIQVYVKGVCDRRLATLIRTAIELNVPVFYRHDKRQPILVEHQLSLSALVPQPHMAFKRTDEGIEYALTLTIQGETIVPSKHHVNVIAAKPGIVTIDDTIYFMDEHFSGKLLMPFRDKDTVFVPQRMEQQYFNNFILHNVANAEVEAEGFDFTDIHPHPSCRLNRVTDIMGTHALTIEYVYGNKAFIPSSKSTSSITLEESENGFRFIRICRDNEWEQHCHDCIASCTANVSGCTLHHDVIRFDCLPTIIDWMRHNARQLRSNGIELEQPSDETYYIGSIDLHEDTEQSGDWLLLRSTITLEDGRTVPFIHLRDSILAGKHEYIMPDGTRIIIPDEWLKRYTPLIISGTEDGGRLRVHKTLYRCPIDNGEVTFSNQKVDNPSDCDIDEEDKVTVHIPTLLHATLRPYQETGYQWLVNHLLHQRGCCLGDEMGLGKTVQAISLLLYYKEISKRQSTKSVGMLFTDEEMSGKEDTEDKKAMPQYTSLVIAPTSLVYNWREELHRFAPSLSVIAYTGTPDERRSKRRTLPSHDVIITTYRTLVNDINHLAPLMYGIIIFDESQAFKNRDSMVHKAVAKLQGLCRIALSGTPVENGLSELWSLFHIIQPNLLGSFSTFSSHYLNSVAPSIEEVRTETLRRIISPYMLKRRKESVLADLPERQDELIICPMSPEQESFYESELSQARNSVMDEKSHQSIRVITAIQRLRQIACHPHLVNQGTQDISSGKMDEVFMRLESIKGTGHKVLLFSEYVGFLKLISTEMASRNWKHAILTGETQQRETVITDFQNDDDCQFFLISLKAGGVGLNLTQADYVFILDPWWNIAAEEQAISRAHRIGQRNVVFVYRFVSERTIEEQVLTLQHNKQAVIDKVLFK